jgi:hypothetical protein
MSMTVLDVPEQGQLVRVRSRQWVVNQVKPRSPNRLNAVVSPERREAQSEDQGICVG